MIDFVEYIVAELKSKRLSKPEAIALVRQFSRHSRNSPGASVLHPLLHLNTSDLIEQRYSSILTGDEFFLTDHRVAVGEDGPQKLLPGVAYLEMARAAIEHASPGQRDWSILELRDIVWAQPLMVSQSKQINIALFTVENQQIDYEIYSQEGEQETVYCQGRADWKDSAELARIDIERLKREIGQSKLDPETLYAACARMGLVYGPSLKTVTVVHRGANQVLAQMRLPEAMENKKWRDYVLHPSLMDGALQACIGLMDSLPEESSQPRLPFALESLQIISPLTEEMFAWVRYAPGGQASDKVVKLDINLCDLQGNICVQMRGFSSRVLGPRIRATGAQGEPDNRFTNGPSVRVEQPMAYAGAGKGTWDLAEKTQAYLCQQFAGVLKMPSHKLDAQTALETYGIDSILAMKLTSQLEKTFGTLSKTLLFEYQTIAELSEYFVANYSAQLTALMSATGEGDKDQEKEASVREMQMLSTVQPKSRLKRGFSRQRSAAAKPVAEEGIAIIGLSGRYPEAVNIEAYWQNLRAGKDCIIEVPKERWDWREYYSEDRSQSGHHYSKWGGFIAGVDEFDPLFFNISPADAELLDPQERIFLQHAWLAMEDAGYTRSSLQIASEQDLAGQVGVYAGVMYSEYQLLGAEASLQGKRIAVANSPASIANRVSYVLNLHGPSMTLDTMCSSSLSAIHYACQDLKQGRTSLAIAGGVNVSIHPNKYLLLSAGQFISSAGQCQSFGEGGDGYIPGEGVGVVVLKRLSEAKRDRDHIYGVIRGSALNHGGKTNGYTVPNPQAQASAIRRALEESRIDARQISYIEAHGTGTRLGDPIEITALSKAFGKDTQERGYCRIGSAKSNIGHCESAAGMAGLTKVLLQMRHEEIVPTLHAERLNPHIDFAGSPFVVNQELGRWERPVIGGREAPRIAGISSFGAGGSNAHLIVEECEEEGREGDEVGVEEGKGRTGTVMVLLSARTEEQLREKARELVEYVGARRGEVDLERMGYTLQVGREGMEERMGMVVVGMEEVEEKLGRYVGGEEGIEGLYRGQVKGNKETVGLFVSDEDVRETVEKWIAGRKLGKLTELWVKGLEVDWSKLWRERKPRRMSLPGYPFAKERYWIEGGRREGGGSRGAAAASTVGAEHPLVQRNSSDLREQRYSSVFSGEEFFLADHRVADHGVAGAAGGELQKVMPAAGWMEMARAAVERAAEAGEGAEVELRDVVWEQGLVVREEKQVHIALEAIASDGEEEDEIEYEIYSGEGEQEVVHCRGRARVGREVAKPERLDIERLKGGMGGGWVEGARVYEEWERRGMVYGRRMQAIRGIYRGSGEVVAELRMPEGEGGEGSGEYGLHPSMVDGALQASIGLMEGGWEGEQQQQRWLPFAMESLRVIGGCTQEMYAWVRYGAGEGAGGGGGGRGETVTIDIDLCDEEGNICTQMRGVSSRLLRGEIGVTAAKGQARGKMYGAPVWQVREVETSIGGGNKMEQQVILCELPEIEVEKLRILAGAGECISLARKKDADIGERYSEYAVECFERVRGILQSKREGKVVVQIVAPQEQRLLAGLSGLLKTAMQENPKLKGQLILVPGEISTEELKRRLEEEKRGQDTVIRYEVGERQVLRWEEVEVEAGKAPMVFKEDGVYLITGGMGGLGYLFAKEIVKQTRQGKVVLTGRSALTAEKRERLEGLNGKCGGRVSYRQLDVEDEEQVRELVKEIGEEYGQLKGILHSAGMIADNFIIKKSAEEFRAVLGPKVRGTYYLDQGSQEEELDFFVMFSSIAGAMGNVGQSDYASGNGFMDEYARYRNEQVARGERHGRTRSINWPLWQEGGMEIDEATLAGLQRATGMQAMETATGLEAFYRSLALPNDQLLVAEGDVEQLRRVLWGSAAKAATAKTRVEQPMAAGGMGEGTGDLAEKTQAYLCQQFAGVLKMPSHKLDAQTALESYGIDSILAMKLTSQLEKTFGTLSKTLLFEYQTIAELTRYFVKAHPGVLRKEIGFLHEESKPDHAEQITTEKTRPASTTRRKKRFPGNKSNYKKEIAIIGLSGRYPQANNLQEFWKNLQNGRDCISEIPAERWDHKLYYDPDYKLGKSYSKWGGFIFDVDRFDPLFFNMSPKEAGLIDPQERLFLETAWETIEDAGYTKENISGSKVGVFVGVMWGHYELFGAQSTLSSDSGIPSSSHASIANRVSYFFNFHGPSIALDTMCSSSLTAIHLACEDLRKGDIDAAIAGGVNVTIHPNKYLSLSQGKFVASDGRCRSFGEGGDGYVPGEGVGAVLLKPLEAALRDGDQIYAVIKSSTVNHGGKTNGYTVPNPNAQGDLILDALRKAKIDPRTLNYIEAHGTGTSLGDPIEITGLSKAFEGFSEEKQFCAIGSVKSNIGHLEAAAGIAAVTKALLQIKYQQLVPSLHAHPPNPHIDFENSPFYVQTELTEWKRPVEHSRRVAVSSFGAGGSNAHLILEEYPDTRESTEPPLAPLQEIFVLSAKNQEALYRYAERMVSFLESACEVSLANIAYTLQVGRTPMDVRLVIIASNKEDLRGKLNQWIALRKNKETSSGADISELDAVFCGSVKEFQYNAVNLIDGQAGKAFLEQLLASKDLEKIARLWILGAEINWSLLNQDAGRRRVTLPTYPFAKERCWLDQQISDTRFAPKNTLDTKKIAAQRRSEETQSAYDEVPLQMGAGISLKSASASRDGSGPVEGFDAATLVARTEEYLKALIGEELKLSPDRINSSDRLESFGIDSVMISRINVHLEKDFGALPKTLLYEHETVREVANFLVHEVREALIALFGYSRLAGDSAILVTEVEQETIQHEVTIETPDDDLEAIAIIGVHGYYPRSANLDEYWENLKQGRDLIDLVPPNRWNSEEVYDPDPAAAAEGKIYCKWGGFLDDFDKFDARFFNIPAEEAKIIDPQERLFLESVWAAIEDAGYTRDGLKKRFPKAKSADVGVFVGVTTSSYQLWAPEEQNQGNFVFPSAMPWSIANRVSYFFDFNGPSMPIDTACSSSLVAVHLACESLRKRECQVAIAGGVNLYLHPSKYRSLCQRRMLSLGGKCHSYGAGDDGFVPGEGVGSVVLKPLSKALRDRDRIHAVIRASAFNHSGRSNGYSAPNPNSQAHLISSALTKAGIDPESISYVEGHGTGTQMGDSIEIAALTQAFQTQTTKKQFCAVGSVKANIGHSESAAGIAGLAKVILQIKHGQLAPSIHSDEVNPDIEFKESPFYLQHELSEWKASPLHPRRALINSFGAGGVNACIVLEQYEDPGFSDNQPEPAPYLFVLSAKSEPQLREYADRLVIHLRSEPAISLGSLCYTLQTGREALEERLAIVASEASQLIDSLMDWLEHGSSPNVHRGALGTMRGSGRRSSTLASKAIEERSLTELASMWAAGEPVDWEALYPGHKPLRIGLPTYPFARERYWFSESPTTEERAITNTQLHPFISYNSSTLKEVSFTSSLSDTAFYAVDHGVRQEGIFPGAAFLEMACISGDLAGEQRVRQIRDVAWIQPLSFRKGPQTLRTVLRNTEEGIIEYEILSHDEEEENETIKHSEGRLVFGSGWASPADAEERLSIEGLKAQCPRVEEGAAYYGKFEKYGLNYGPSFQTIQRIYVSESFALSRLEIPDHLKRDFGRFILHPSLIDGALQTVAALIGGLESAVPQLPFALDELDILHPVRQTCYAYAEFAASPGKNQGGGGKFQIRVLNESGDVLIRFKNLYLRPLAKSQESPDSAAAADLAVTAGD